MYAVQKDKWGQLFYQNHHQFVLFVFIDALWPNQQFFSHFQGLTWITPYSLKVDKDFFFFFRYKSRDPAGTFEALRDCNMLTDTAALQMTIYNKMAKTLYIGMTGIK